jgi:hypothetical protein
LLCPPFGYANTNCGGNAIAHCAASIPKQTGCWPLQFNNSGMRMGHHPIKHTTTAVARVPLFSKFCIWWCCIWGDANSLGGIGV